MTRIDKLEQDWGLRFPERHRKALQDPSDPIHSKCDFLLLESDQKFMRLSDLNEWIHGPQFHDTWPSQLFAFASNGCGDYFAYHLSGDDHLEVIYMDPDKTVQENLNKWDQSMHFDSFEAWHEHITRKE